MSLIGQAYGDLVSDLLWLENLLVEASASAISEYEYGMLRHLLLADQRVGPALPEFVRDCSTLAEFRAFIDEEIPDRWAREEYLRKQFEPLVGESDLESLPVRIREQAAA
jgi:hypothetical protein